MTDPFFGPGGFTEVSDASQLNLSRSHDLLRAIASNRDYTLLRLLKRDGKYPECIVVDVETDAVPPRSPSGIQFRERLALFVSSDVKTLIDVRTLRKAFPLLPHQNAVGFDQPLSLCLYFEPPRAVLRTWTAESFLRRIQWWLEKSAKDQLHAADQPVENVFFVSPHEIVLPWDARTSIGDPGRRFVVSRVLQRPNNRGTSILESIPAAEVPPNNAAAIVEIPLPPIVSGIIERTPQTLGELESVLEARGAAFSEILKARLFDQVEAAGKPAGEDAKFTIFLLQVPITRTVGGGVEKIKLQAFLIPIGPLEFGAQCGALFVLEGRFYRDFDLNGTSKAFQNNGWKAQPIEAVEILYENDAQAARAQSDLNDKGPKGTLIGAGSLGSAMLNLWSREGWGKWTVIDQDHIKPHNLSRHVAFRQHIGHTKVEVAAQLYRGSMGEGAVTPVFGDACALDDSEISMPIRAAEIVVDISTTLEYPRLSSTRDDLPRHASAFITPSGNSAVLMIEDKQRAIRLRTLEAQYYRAIIQNLWGEHHLDKNLGTFWSGAGCRDISVVLPYSRIVSHASLLAEQVPTALKNEEATIRVWSRDAGDGSVSLQTLRTHGEQQRALLKVTAYFDVGLEAQLRALRDAHLPNETGGVLLGYYDFNIAAVVIVCGLPAPPDSISTPTSFERGTAGLVEAVNEATRRTGHVVGYIGEWHTHPKGHSAKPSHDDFLQLLHLAYGMAGDGLPALQLIVGEREIEVIQCQVVS